MFGNQRFILRNNQLMMLQISLLHVWLHIKEYKNSINVIWALANFIKDMHNQLQMRWQSNNNNNKYPSFLSVVISLEYLWINCSVVLRILLKQMMPSIDLRQWFLWFETFVKIFFRGWNSWLPLQVQTKKSIVCSQFIQECWTLMMVMISIMKIFWKKVEI